MNRLLLSSLALFALVTPACAEDDTPAFKKRGTPDKKFWESVGEKIVKTARTSPKKITMDAVEVKAKADKPTRKIVTIKMVWYGSVTGKRFVSDIKLDCDASNEDTWELLTVDYTDSDALPRVGSDKRIKELITKFNR